MNINEKVILVDCDGVLCDWEYAFDVWMRHHGNSIKVKGEYLMSKKYGIENEESKSLIRHFNESAAIGFLPPLRDAMHYVKKLHEEHGYVFHCITSLSNDPNAQKLRTLNLERLFGKTVFEKFVYLDTGADKDKALDEYRNTECFWVEDKPENATVGATRGLKSIVVNHLHNASADFGNLDIVRVNNWKEIYELVVGF